MNKERLLNRFYKYVKCDSESFHEKNYCLMMEEELKALGFTIWREEQAGRDIGSDGWNIGAYLPGEGEPMMFCAHLDTVTPGQGIEPVLTDGVIRSAGDTILGADDKSGVAGIMEAVEYVLENNLPHRPIEILFTLAEEMGLLGAAKTDYTKFKSKRCIVLDATTPGEMIHRAPIGTRSYYKFHGVAAHAAANPEKGRSALKAAADAVSNIPVGRVDDQTVMNVNNFLAPGATNIVNDYASFDMELRSFSEEILQRRIGECDKAAQDACDKFGTTYEKKLVRYCNLLDVPTDSPLSKELIAAYDAMGVPWKFEMTYGSNDSSHIFAAGISAMAVGTGMKQVHGVDEYIERKDLEHTAELCLRIIQDTKA